MSSSAALLAATVAAAGRTAAPESASTRGISLDGSSDWRQPAPASRLSTAHAQRNEVRVWTARALATVLAEVGADFERRTGYALVVTSDLPSGFERRALADEVFDVLITASAPLDQWIRDGRIVATTRTDIARSGIGVAVREHTPPPDIGSVEALTRTLLDARSVAYLRVGSGLYMEGLVERLGIAAALAPKTLRPDTESSRRWSRKERRSSASWS